MINPINEVVFSDAFNERLNALSKTVYVDSQIASVIQQLQTGDANVFNNSKIYTDDKVASLVSSAPSTLDTLNELATALGDDPNFATTMSNQIGKKADKILVPVNNNILIMDENGNLKDSGIASSNVGQLSISKDWSALQNFNAGAFVNIATNKYNASELINSYPKGYSMMWLNATNGFPITTGYGFVITFNIGTCGYQEIVEMYTGADTSVKQRRWFRTKRDSNNFWQPFQEIWTSGFMGAGSTLDADKLDGKEGSYYNDYTNLANKPDVYTKTEMNGIVNGLATKNDLNVAVDDINTDIGSATLSTNDKTVKGAINEVKNAIPTSLPANGGDANTAQKFKTARNIALTGDVTGNVNFDGSSNASIATTLTNSGVNAGTYRSVTVDAKGRVKSGTNPTTRDGYGLSDVPTKTEVDNTLLKYGIGGFKDISNTDLNNLLITGLYSGNGLTNAPSNANSGYSVIVINGSTGYCRQIAINTMNKLMAYRLLVDGIWSDWTQLANKDEVDSELNNKVDKISGKSLSTNDFDNTYKSKLDGIATGATTVTASTTNGNVKINGTETNIYTHPGSGTNPHGTTKSDIGLSNVTNDAQVKRVEMNVANGVATTDANNKLVQDAKTLGGLSSDKLLRSDVDTTANGLITANKGIQTGKFKIEYNTDTTSLDFEFIE